jgi:hypothetical protein
MSHTTSVVFSSIARSLKRRKRAKLRKLNLDAVEKLGFTPKRISSAGPESLYVFIDEHGRVYDNGGKCYLSSLSLLEAAKRVSSGSNEIEGDSITQDSEPD